MSHQLYIKAKKHEYYDECNDEFRYFDQADMIFEYSLYTMSLYEMEYEEPFVDCKDAIKLFKCMLIESNPRCAIDYTVIKSKIENYMSKKYTATTLKRTRKGTSRNIKMTTEVLYAQMAINGIPPEYDRWHLNRLLALLGVVGELNKEPEKMDPKEQAQMELDMIRKRNAEIKNGNKNRI